MKMSFLNSSMFLGTLVAVSMISNPSAQAFSLSETNNTVTIDTGDSNETFEVLFNGFTLIQSQITNIPGLTSTALFTLVNFNGSNANFNVNLANTSSGNTTASEVSVLGFDVTGNPTASIAPGGVFDRVARGPVLNLLESLDVCFKGGGGRNNCSFNGNNDGIAIGDEGDFSFSLAFASPVEQFVLDDFAVRYKDVNSTDPVLSPVLSRLGATGVGTVPTPALLPGLIGMGVAALRKRKQGELVEQEA